MVESATILTSDRWRAPQYSPLIGHQDPLFVYKKHDYIATSVEALGRDSYNTGDRMSTLMLYLTEVTAGGYTAFPRLGVAVRSDKKTPNLELKTKIRKDFTIHRPF